jgi:hypothetical protein
MTAADYFMLGLAAFALGRALHTIKQMIEEDAKHDADK